jgi:hypothetical protein
MKSCNLTISIVNRVARLLLADVIGSVHLNPLKNVGDIDQLLSEWWRNEPMNGRRTSK